MKGSPHPRPPGRRRSGRSNCKVNTKTEDSNKMRTLDKPSCGNRFPTDVQPVPGGFVMLVSHLLDFLSSANCGVHARVMNGSEACELCPSSGPTQEGGPLPLREHEIEASFGAVNVPLSPCWYGLSWTGRDREGAGPCQGWCRSPATLWRSVC